MRAIIDILYRAKRLAWRLLRLRTRGVKVMLFDDAGDILLIRNSYGRDDLFVLPGGGIGRSEGADEAARREVREELGCEVDRLRQVGTFTSAAEGKRDTVFLFTAHILGTPVADGVEVAEARFFPLASLPASISSATLRRIEEHEGRRRPDGRW